MKTQFRIEELERIIHPHDLVDVLSSLTNNGLIESYTIDYRGGDVFIDIPRSVEVNEIMAGFRDIPNTGRKRGSN